MAKKVTITESDGDKYSIEVSTEETARVYEDLVFQVGRIVDVTVTNADTDS